MVRKDKKVFVLSLVASSFALMTTLKAQNYSYEGYANPYIRVGGQQAQKAMVEVRPLTRNSSELIDLSSVYADGVSVAYTNDKYPINDVAATRKVMRVASVPNSFRAGSSDDWTVRIGSEEVVPLGMSGKGSNKIDTLRHSRGMQYGDLRVDEIAVGSEGENTAVSLTDGKYTYPEHEVVDEQAFVEQELGVKSNYKSVSVSETEQQGKSYPWVKAYSKYSVSGSSVPDNQYASAYLGEKVENPWSEKSPASEGVRSIKIQRKNVLQQRQQAELIVDDISVDADLSAQGFEFDTSLYPQEDVASFESYADGASSDRFELETVEVKPVLKQKIEAVREVPVVAAVEEKVEAVKTVEEKKRPLLVPISEPRQAKEAKPELVELNAFGDNTGVVAEYKVDVVPAKPIVPINPVVAEDVDDNISLTELKINFRPFKSDMSVKTVRWLKEFSKKAAVNFDNIVEIRVSPNLPYLQNERLLMLKGILNSNGVYDQQIRVIANRKSADSVIVKVIINDDVEELPEIVNYQDLNGSYYYYY